MSNYLRASHLTRRELIDDSDVVTQWTSYGQREPAAPTVTGPTDCTTVRNYNWAVGFNVPNFHRRLRVGELLPMTPFWKWSVDGSSLGSYDCWSGLTTPYYHSWVVGNFSYFENWNLDYDDIASYIPASYDQYVVEAMAAVYGNGHDTLTFLAELKDIKRLWQSVAKRLLKLDLKDLLSFKGMVSQWLELRYGWRTLIYDIQQINQAVKSFTNVQTRYSERRGTKYSSTFDDAWSTEQSHFWLDHSIHDEIRVSIRGSVVSDIEVPKFQFNPFVTAWELIPLSFVIDWFFNVGRTIAAITYAAKSGDYTAAKGYKVELTRTYQCEIGETKETHVSGNWTQNATCSAVVEKRQPCRVPNSPQFILKLNSLKILDLIALIVQRI